PPADRRLEGGPRRPRRAAPGGRRRGTGPRRAVVHAAPRVAGRGRGPPRHLPGDGRPGRRAGPAAGLRRVTAGTPPRTGRRWSARLGRAGRSGDDGGMTEVRLPEPDRPWLMRTYSGHSTAKASNELYRRNLAKGQTGLSIAFDLPTQTGYDPDHPLARGEVGKVGVPVAHLGHMQELLDGIPPAEMNTSMTINATAAWLLGLYVANAELQGVPSEKLRGTTQNDIVKEYLSRGTYIFP